MTQITDVKPLVTVATYLDKNEATEAYQEVSGTPTWEFGPWVMQYVVRISELRSPFVSVTHIFEHETVASCQTLPALAVVTRKIRLRRAGRTYFPLDGGPPKERAGPQPELRMQTRGSKFVRFQEMKLQERAIEVPTRPPATLEHTFQHCIRCSHV